MAGEALDLAGQVEHRLGDVAVVGGRVDQPVGVDLLRPGVEGAGGMAEGPAHVAHRRLGPVGDDVGHLGRVLPAVAVVDVLDGLLPPVVLDVDVDVGRAVALGGQEPLEEQLQAHRVGVGDAQGVADGAVGGRPPSLAVDVVAPAELDDVPHDEEVAGEAEGVDHGQLVLDLAVGARDPLGAGAGRAVPLGCAPHGELPQPAHLGVAVGHRVVGEVGGHQAKVEGAVAADLGRPLHHARVAGEAAGLLGARPQAGRGRRRQPAVELVEGAAGPHRGQRGGEGTPGRGGVVDVVGGHHVDPGFEREGDEGVVAGRVEGVAVVPELDGHAVAAEGVDEMVELPGGGSRPAVDKGGGHGALPATGEHLPPPAVPWLTCDCGQVLESRFGKALLPGAHVGGAGGAAEAGVAVGVAGQHQQVAALGVGRALLRPAGQVEGELGAEDGGHVEGGRRLGEADDAVEAVVVGEGQGLQPQPGRLLGQFLGVGGAVEEAEVGVTVQLGVGDGSVVAGRLGGWIVRGPLVGPGGAVTAVGVERASRQPPLQLRPRHRRIDPTHSVDCSRTYVRLTSGGVRAEADSYS